MSPRLFDFEVPPNRPHIDVEDTVKDGQQQKAQQWLLDVSHPEEAMRRSATGVPDL
jgi:hypothetical protein